MVGNDVTGLTVKQKRLKHMLGGRPCKWDTAEELEEAITSYFDSITDDDGNWMKPPTITGLAIALNVDRSTINNYSKREKFFLTVSRARKICELFLEELMLTSNNANLRFVASNNFDWKEKQLIEVDSTPADKAILEARERKRSMIQAGASVVDADFEVVEDE